VVGRWSRPDLDWCLKLRLRCEGISSTRLMAPRHHTSSSPAIVTAHQKLWAKVAAQADEAPPLLVIDTGTMVCEAFKPRCAALVRAINALFPASERTVILHLGGVATSWAAAGPRGGLLRGQQRLREADGIQHACAYVLYPAAARALLARKGDHEAPSTLDQALAQSHAMDGLLRALVAVPALAWREEA